LGYVPPASGVACVSLCGDGIMITADEQCDDGNLVSGDGCSSTCTIESDFECFTFPMEPTKCSYSKPLQVEIQSITKDPNRNSLSMNIQLGPVMPNLADLNFSTLIRASVPLLNPVFTLSPTGLLTISYDYNQTL
jgi:cysteine-rich repeat protein